MHVSHDAIDNCSGVWSRTRVYQGMITQTPVSMFEYSSYPMKQPEKTFYDMFDGIHVCEYLEAFAQSKKFAEKTIKDRIKFQSKVTKIMKEGAEWTVTVNETEKLQCRKLILAIGLTSTPILPTFEQQDFIPPIIHTKGLADQTDFLLSPSIQKIVVIGGSKSAFDAVQMLCDAGKSVSWLIRKTGEGPAILAAPDAPPPLSNSHEIISLRLVTSMNPSIFHASDGVETFFHRTSIGKWLTASVWSAVEGMWIKPAKYDRNENFKLLKSDRPGFWHSSSLGVSNSPGIWDTVAKSTIYRDEIVRGKGSIVTLSSGEMIDCDAIVACTGWDSTYTMFDSAQAASFGLPLPRSASASDHEDVPVQDNSQEKWDALLQEADELVVKRFPMLASPPSTIPVRTPNRLPHRLYRSLIPIDIDENDRSIVFLGNLQTVQCLLIAEIQSLWACAYLMDKLEVPSQEEMEKDVALTIAWRRRRYLGDGVSCINDQIPVCLYSYPVM